MKLSEIYKDECDYPTVDAAIYGYDVAEAARMMKQEGAIMSAGTGYRYRIYDGELQRRADSWCRADPDERGMDWHTAAMDPKAFMSHAWAADGHAPMSQTERMTMYRLLIEGYDVIYFLNRGDHATLCRTRRDGDGLMTWEEFGGERLDTGEEDDMTIYATGEIWAVSDDRENMNYKQINRRFKQEYIEQIRRTMRSVRRD